MMAAETNMGSTVPAFVRSELEIYLNYVQYTGCNDNNGAFGYSYQTNYPNVTKAAAGIICHEFIGTPLTDSRIQMALGYIYRHWNDTSGGWTYSRNIGNSYSMYAVMKAMRIPEPDILEITEYNCTIPGQTTNTFDWYYTPGGQTQQGLATYLVNAQQSNGSWDDIGGPNPVWDAFSTGWGVLILLKGVSIIPPVAQICDSGDLEFDLCAEITLDGSCSYHPDLTKTIVLYEWDLDGDGEYDDAVGETATIPADTFCVEGHYPIGLRVTDNNPIPLGGPQTGIQVSEVFVHPPCHDPHADANGPYLGQPGVPVTLDASGSWDPDSVNLTYEWDLDGDGQFDDANSINPSWTWATPFVGVIGLKVTDDGCHVQDGDEFYTGWDVDYTTVEIGNHPPVSDPNGPYSGSSGSTITLDGTGSYDPDAGDPITYAWDLDGDGEYDDSVLPNPEYTIGPTGGTVCLRVTDSFGESDIACTTVVVDETNEPPVIAGLPDKSLEEDTSLDNEIDLWVNASDAEDPDIDLDFSIVGNTNPDCGVSIDTNRYIDISPTLDWNGQSDVTIQVTDTGGLTDTDTFRITVSPVNDPPIAGDNAYTTDEDTPLTVSAPGVLDNDTDVDGDALTVATVDTLVTIGLVTAWGSDGSFTYDPNGQFESLDDGETDADTFAYTASDGNGGIDTATVTIHIEGVNDAPVANDDDYSTAENTQLVVAAPGVLANDTDVEGDVLTAVLVDDVTHGSLTLNADGSFTYDPELDFWGIDSFTYMANDGDLDSNEVTVTIRVIPHSVVTSSSLCTFDFDQETEGDQFRLILTPHNDPRNTFKLSASNPGQFFYNLYYPDGGSIEVTIPYPFVTQGAMPIHFYGGVEMVENNSQFCFSPVDPMGSDDQKVILGEEGDPVTLTIDIPEGATFVTIHLDYGLKGTAPYTPGGVDQMNAIGDDGEITDTIKNLTSYVFSADDGSVDTGEIQNINSFKKTPGIGGLVTAFNGDPLPGETILIDSDILSEIVELMTDEDGWYMWNYKHKGKRKGFTVECSDLTTVGDNPVEITLRANQFVIVNFQRTT
jgi:VCBS repeat-containing protein